MPAIQLTVDTTNWRNRLDLLGRRAPLALARALNRTATSERTAMARAVATDMGIKVGAARDAIKVERASSAKLSARVISRGKRLPLIDFKARGPMPSRGRGAGVRYTMQGQRKTWRGSFITTVTRAGDDGQHAGHLGVFFRRGKARLPIKQAYGPSIAHVFGKMIPVGEARRNEVLLKNVEHEIEFELSRLRGGT